MKKIRLQIIAPLYVAMTLCVLSWILWIMKPENQLTVPRERSNYLLTYKSFNTTLAVLGFSETMREVATLKPEPSPVVYLPIQDFYYNLTGPNYKRHSEAFKYDPRRDIFNNLTGPNPDDRSVLVVPRRAYYDNRLVEGKTRNILVILAEVEENTTGKIVACEINGNHSKSVKIVKEDISWLNRNRPGHTHWLVIVQCKGLPEEAIVNGSDTWLIYKLDEDDFYSRVQTEKPLLVEISAVRKNSVLVCTTLFGHPARFEPWLKYQKTLGVDLVKLNVHSTFSDNATQIYPFLKEAIDSGFVEMETWTDITGNRFYYHGKLVKLQDCVYRYMNRFEYGLFFDHDDFFNPVTPDKDIHHHLSYFFANETTGSVYFSWREMECGPLEDRIRTLADGNLTNILSGSKMNWRKTINKKCASRLSAVDYVEIHRVKRFLPGYRPEHANETVAYVAHNRETTKGCG